MLDHRQKQHKKVLAQAATEVAIFGGILLFVIGSILKLGFQQSMNMNQQLRAMRMALSESWKSAQGHYSGGQISLARNSASVMLVEDRLSIDAGQKLGTRDRIPFITSGSGMLTQNLMYSFEWGMDLDIPVLDLIVNGQRFPLTAAAFWSYGVPAVGSLAPCLGPHTLLPSGKRDSRCTENDCYTKSAPPPMGGGPPPPAGPSLPCLVYYTEAINGKEKFDPVSGGDPTRMERFDLDFDGNPEPALVASADLRAHFMWQWRPVAAILDSDSIKNAAVIALTANMTAQGAELLNIESVSTNRPGLDVDGDGYGETIFSIASAGGLNPEYVSVFNVLDMERGDFDTSYEATGPNDKPGLQEESQMYSKTYANPKIAEGTYYRIQDGKIFSPTDGTFIRNTTRQDHVDLVMRVLRLSNDTHRFCCPTDAAAANALSGCRTGTGTAADPYVPRPGQPRNWASVLGLMGIQNPVEVCVRNSESTEPYSPCFYEVNTEKTCMDQDLLLIFIRSRIQDIRGSRWITRTDLGEKIGK
jgi:hypothetical protein